MKTSSKGIAFIKSFEQLRLDRYPDSAGLPTIGFGHRLQPGEDYQTISTDQADDIFLSDLSHTERAINQAVEIILSQNEYDGCVSLAFNIGPGSFARSTLVKLLNRGNTEGASAQFLLWDHSGPVEIPGLRDRCPTSGKSCRFWR